jgi:hypothetical protein
MDCARDKEKLRQWIGSLIGNKRKAPIVKVNGMEYHRLPWARDRRGEQ